MVPFAGWDMPVQFSGLVTEHKAVRTDTGMFDISHMGVLRIEGANPKELCSVSSVFLVKSGKPFAKPALVDICKQCV